MFFHTYVVKTLHSGLVIASTRLFQMTSLVPKHAPYFKLNWSTLMNLGKKKRDDFGSLLAIFEASGIFEAAGAVPNN